MTHIETILHAKAIPTSTSKEWMSVAYIQAVAAQVGLNIRPAAQFDNGLDLAVGSIKPIVEGHNFPNLWIGIQLKATHNWEVEDGCIRFFLERKNYDLLRLQSPTQPQYLVLYTLPKARCKWISNCTRTASDEGGDDRCSEFRHAAFFVSLEGQSELALNKKGFPRTGKTIKIPIANRLTAISLLRLYKQFARTVLSWGVTHV